MQTIGVKDGTFQDLPEIRHLCPCSIVIHSCETPSGNKFSVGLVDHSMGVSDFQPVAIYPLGNDFARRVCLAVFGKVLAA